MAEVLDGIKTPATSYQTHHHTWHPVYLQESGISNVFGSLNREAFLKFFQCAPPTPKQSGLQIT